MSRALIDAIKSIQGRCHIFNDALDLYAYMAQRIETIRYDGIFIDLDVNDSKIAIENQLHLYQDLRQKGLSTPFLFCFANSKAALALSTSNIEFVDFVFKPANDQELLTRMEVLIQRQRKMRQEKTSYNSAGRASAIAPSNLSTSANCDNTSHVANAAPKNIRNSALRFDNLHIDIELRRVELSGNTVALTAKEFKILTLLASQPQKVFSRLELLNTVWGCNYAGYDHTVSSHINRLRAKLSAANSMSASPKYIHTVWGVGYRFIQ